MVVTIKILLPAFMQENIEAGLDSFTLRVPGFRPLDPLHQRFREVPPRRLPLAGGAQGTGDVAGVDPVDVPRGAQMVAQRGVPLRDPGTTHVAIGMEDFPVLPDPGCR